MVNASQCWGVIRYMDLVRLVGLGVETEEIVVLLVCVRVWGLV